MVGTIDWQDDQRFVLNGIQFRLSEWGGKGSSSPDKFLILKNRWMVERYLKILDKLQPKRIFELGIKRGGSAVLLQEYCAAEKLVAIDICEERQKPLDEYIHTNNLAGVLRPKYGIDQSDAQSLRSIVAEEFGAQLIDLVIDDASHLLEQTRASFDALFPYVRPGGVYVIEDWPWAHKKVDQSDLPDINPGKQPLSKLVFEIIMACPSTYDYIEEIVVDRNSIAVWRGDAVINPDGFRVQNCILPEGLALISKE